MQQGKGERDGGTKSLARTDSDPFSGTLEQREAVTKASIRSVNAGPPSRHVYWIQGVVCAVTLNKKRMILDDGTGCVIVDFRFHDENFGKDMYILVIGQRINKKKSGFALLMHQFKDLSATPDRESLWLLELTEVELIRRGISTTAVD